MCGMSDPLDEQKGAINLQFARCPVLENECFQFASCSSTCLTNGLQCISCRALADEFLVLGNFGGFVIVNRCYQSPFIDCIVWANENCQFAISPLPLICKGATALCILSTALTSSSVAALLASGCNQFAVSRCLC